MNRMEQCRFNNDIPCKEKQKDRSDMICHACTERASMLIKVEQLKLALDTNAILRISNKLNKETLEMQKSILMMDEEEEVTIKKLTREQKDCLDKASIAYG